MNAQRVIGVVSLLALGSLIGGCASVQVTPVSVAQESDPAIAGVRFFQPEPYLLVTQLPARPMGPMPGIMPKLMPGMMPGMQPRMGPGMGPNMGQPMIKPSAGRWDRRSHAKAMMSKHRGLKNMKHHNAPADMPNDVSRYHRDMTAMMDGHNWHGPTQRGRAMGKAKPPMPMMALRMPPQPPTYELQIIYLPDYSHPYVANIQGGFGRSANSLILANGWELLGINVKGRITQAKPIRAITAAPAMPPHPRMMMRRTKPGMMPKMNMVPDRSGWHKKAGAKAVRNWRSKPGWKQGQNMTVHPMIMPGPAALALGLHPGLYAFVFNPRTGKLEGLRPVRLLKAYHQPDRWGMMYTKHRPWNSPSEKPGATPAGDTGK